MYFSDFYKQDMEIDSQCQKWILEHMPRMFDQSSNENMEKPISIVEIEEVLKSFTHDKIPEPDGWLVMFFVHFFDILRMNCIL